ncbi:MAG TPA: hypothetical protein VFA90_12320 [Terriglobales bacterium]|nr:hypothetical protein [Terriglobales bacterium]
MNTLIANQYGRVQGEVGGSGPVLAVAAQTPRRDLVQLHTHLDSVEQQLYLLAILRAVERRIEQFQLRDSSAAEPQAREPESPFEGSVCAESDLFNANGASKNKIYGRFANFLIYEQVDQGRLRVFFAVRDEAKRVARFDLHPGEVQALCALVRRALFGCEQIDLLLRDDLSLTVALQVSGNGLHLQVQTPLWRSEFGVTKGNELATLAVFAQRAVHQEKVVPIRFGDEANQFSLRRRSDGQVLAEFQHKESVERVPLSTLQLYELEVLTHYALHRAFEPSDVSIQSHVPPPSETAAQIA